MLALRVQQLWNRDQAHREDSGADECPDKLSRQPPPRSLAVDGVEQLA